MVGPLTHKEQDKQSGACIHLPKKMCPSLIESSIASTPLTPLTLDK